VKVFDSIHSGRINWISTKLVDPNLGSTKLEIDEWGEKGLRELKKKMQGKTGSILFLFLSCAAQKAHDEKRYTDKFVFGRFIGTGVLEAQKQKVFSKQQEIEKGLENVLVADGQGFVRNLTMPADEKMTEWTAEKLGEKFVKVCGARRFKKYIFGEKEIYEVGVRDSSESRGFEIKSEASKFANKYYRDILEALSSKSLNADSEVVQKYFDAKTKFLGNGHVCDNVDSWIQLNKAFVAACGAPRVSRIKVEITSWTSHSFVAEYSVCIELDDGKEANVDMMGTARVEMSQENEMKILSITETSTEQSIKSIRKNLASRLGSSRS